MKYKISNEELLEKVRCKAKQEQNLTFEVIDLIRQVGERRLFLELGFSSLFDFVTKDLGYEPSSAMRRIQAARLVSEIPEVKTKIEDGRLSLSVVSQVQSFCRREEKSKGKKLTHQQKIAIFNLVENKTTREAEKELVKISPEGIQKTESVREISSDLTELKILMDSELKNQLDELKLVLSHQNPDMTYLELIRLMASKLRKSLRKDAGQLVRAAKDGEVSQQFGVMKTEGISKLKAVEREKEAGNTGAGLISDQVGVIDRVSNAAPIPSIAKPQLLPAPVVATRYIPVPVKRYVWMRDKGCCQYLDVKTGRQCQSKYQVQIDHIRRFRDGGQNTSDNLRLLCRAHNNWRG